MKIQDFNNATNFREIIRFIYNKKWWNNINKLELFESDLYDYYNLPNEEDGVLKLKIT